MRRVVLPLAALLLTAGCLSGGGGGEAAQGGSQDMDLTSSAFDEGGEVPVKYTCDGEDVSPPLSWSGVPEEAKSLVLIVDDPDAPGGTFTHWVSYDIPPSTTGLGEGESAGSPGSNDFPNKEGYGGPCPPSGTHTYRFKLYALDTELGLGPGASKPEVEGTMEGHVLDEAVLKVDYSR